MNRPPLRRALAAAALASTFACAAPPEDAAERVVVATIFPVADLVARVVGPEIRVETLLPPRASPDTWEATPGQLRALARATGYIAVGGGLDAWLGDLQTEVVHVPSLVLTEGMALRASAHEHGPDDEEHDADTGDPHVWLDPILVRDELLPRLTAFLQGIFPEDSGAIALRADALADTLTALDAGIREALAGTPRTAFVATHDAWAYFAARYGLVPLGVIYERPGHEPSVRGMAELIRGARAEGVDVLLAEPQLAETGARALAREMGASIRVVDPLGGANVPGRGSYTDMMRTNAREFARALGGR